MSQEPAEYKVELDAYSGPLDLLLYLIRREEVDIYNIPIAHITEQYLRYIELLSELNINVAGEFVVMAATLIEIKSRMMTPEPEPMPEEESEDPRLELVRQLMEYRRFKEAALALTERADQRAERFARPGERVGDAAQPQALPSLGASLWTLLEAFSRLLEQTGERGPHRILLDTVSQDQLQAELEQRVRTAGRLSFFNAFNGRPERARLVGLFLALLELVRQQVIRVEQPVPFGEIWLTYVPPEERQGAQTAPSAEAEPVSPQVAPAPAETETATAELDEEWPAEEELGLELPEVLEIPETEPPQPNADAG